MKKSILLAASLLALNFTPAFGQPNRNLPLSPGFQPRLNEIVNNANGSQSQPPALTKFNLDFSGGTPADLVKAIEKAMGKPLNAIIPDENADTKIPALKMSNVDVPHLFNAVVNMSYKYEPSRILGGLGQQRDVVSSYGFETKDNDVSDDSIWYFFVYKTPTQQAPPPPEKVCQFYSLSPYLDRGFTVDDITTAIQTGWKMAGVNPPPELNYHKETKLLIAFGEPSQLQTVQQVLQTLPSSNATRNELNLLNSQVTELTHQVTQLMKKISNPPPVPVLPEEKSGK